MQLPRLAMTPPQVFAVSSLLLIVATALAISVTQSSFYRQEIIDRESVIIRDIVNAIVLDDLSKQELSLADLDNYREAPRRARLERSFKALTKLSGVTLVKIFDRNGTIVWSDDPAQIGTTSTFHAADLKRARGGDTRAILIPGDYSSIPIRGLPATAFIEFYVPFSMTDPGAAVRTVSGVAAIYRSPDELNDTIRHGLVLLWLVTGLGGAVLFGSLFKLFQTVYHRQREAESRFVKLSSEHERIIQVEKLSAVGQMVSEIAHQLNNPLVGVVNLAELAEGEADNPQRVRELLADVRRAGEDCRGFVQRMLQFNAVSRSEPQSTEMGQLVREAIEFFQQSMSGHPIVNLEQADGECTADVDPVLLRHALFNLIHNAFLADPDGRVTVSIAREDLKGASLCRIDVLDRGPGIKPEVAAKLFTPFFTTRPSGTGLGLSVAQQIVMQHRGRIQGENRRDGGARFTIWLPASR